MSRIRRFIAKSWSELNKVSWPNRVQVRNLTVLVFVVSFVVGLYITVADTGFDYVVRSLASLGS